MLVIDEGSRSLGFGALGFSPPVRSNRRMLKHACIIFRKDGSSTLGIPDAYAWIRRGHSEVQQWRNGVTNTPSSWM